MEKVKKEYQNPKFFVAELNNQDIMGSSISTDGSVNDIDFDGTLIG